MTKLSSVFVTTALALLASLTLVAPAGAAADACPNATVRAQQDAADLPDCRAYEMVSPADKGQMPVFLTQSAAVGITESSSDGQTAVFPSWGIFADGLGGMPIQYRSRRTAAGWTTEAASPPPKTPDPDAISDFLSTWYATNPTLETGILRTNDRYDPLDLNSVKDIYRARGTSTPELVSRGNGDERITTTNPVDHTRFGGMSRDGRHVVFEANSHLVAEDAGRVDGWDLYDRFDGKTYLLNQTGSGSLINKCGSQFGQLVTRNRVSDDGRRIIFDTPGVNSSGDPDCSLPTQIYMRVDHEHTVHVSASQRTVPDPSGTSAATYQGATADGSTVFFTSSEMLTDDAPSGGALYRYDTGSGQLSALRSLADVNAMVKISDDGSHIYFMSYYELIPGQGLLGGMNIYLLADGVLKWVTTDTTGYLFSGTLASPDENARNAVVTPDGRHLLFASTAQLTAFDNAGRAAVYLYSDDDSRLTCLSCDPAGQRPAASIVRSDATIATRGNQDPSITADGKTVVFQSGDQLVAGDTNNKTDIYRYKDERLALVTPGTTSGDALLVGMSRDGDNVFFTTADSLVSSDVDGGNLDMYDARVGGGFAQQPALTPPVCSGDSCQGQPASQAPAAPIASVFFAGPSDTGPGDRPSRGKVTVSKSKVVTGSSGTLTVKVPGAGRLSTTGSGLVTTRRSLARAATVHVKVALTAQARSALVKGRKTVKKALRVTFAPTGKAPVTARVTVSFKPSSKASRTAAQRQSKQKGGR
jgi:WD40 repeat protein